MAVGLKGLAAWPEIDGYLDHALDLAPAVTNLSNTVDESHRALIEARALSGQRLKP